MVELSHRRVVKQCIELTNNNEYFILYTHPPTYGSLCPPTNLTLSLSLSLSLYPRTHLPFSLFSHIITPLSPPTLSFPLPHYPNCSPFLPLFPLLGIQAAVGSDNDCIKFLLHYVLMAVLLKAMPIYLALYSKLN